MSDTKVAFIGLGVMGYPMAGHLKSDGYDVTVYNRTQSKADKWVAEYGGQQAATLIPSPAKEAAHPEAAATVRAFTIKTIEPYAGVTSHIFRYPDSGATLPSANSGAGGGG